MTRLLLFLLLAATAHAQQPAVQVVHPRHAQQRALLREALRPFRAVGIRPHLVRLIPSKLPRATGTGIALLAQYDRYRRSGARTLLLVPAPADQFGRPVSSGAAPIGGDVAVCTLTGSRYLDTRCIAHELGHSFGATHRADGIMNPSGLGPLYFSPESVAEMAGSIAR